MSKNTTVYVVDTNGELAQATTVAEVSKLVGFKVTKKAIEAGEVENVSIAEVVAPTEEALEVIQEAIDGASTDTQEEDTTLTDTHEEDTPPAVEDSGIEFPEVGHFKDEKHIKKYIKKLSNAELEEWCELEGAQYKPSEHEAINRMRQAMAIKAIHFPDTAPKAGSSKKKSKYADYSTEQLVQMALDNDIEVKDDKGDSRILRMYTIMALRNAGLLG